ncbi:MAG: leucine--tRNA ligase [Chloroflexi bacterium]|nr:leucine--tRNA ligase [Chloroflexota bacterium]MBP8057849.1 leucine--tRNA ligase [Chloroflexota bacterium]
MITPYNFQAQQAKWQSYWQAIDLYKTTTDPDKPKQYILDFFPYPSGEGLSMGHGRNYIPTCVYSRFQRRRGYNVLHPMGWDAFGLPAENYAIRTGVHPAITTKRNTRAYRHQLELMECSYDWSREINSTDPAYYRWTQWFFLMLFQRGLAYRARGKQWWCPHCQTVLANEQVDNGQCERCGTSVETKDLEQWYFKITQYAERLLDDLATVDWPEKIKTIQRNWIGRSEGFEVIFRVEKTGISSQPGTWDIPVYTTRLDTLFGVTFLALAPEHPLVPDMVTTEQHAAANAYINTTQTMPEIDRLSTIRQKTGVFTGSYAIHPITGQPIPIWIADYVLMGYGTGAIMGVPGHDERDYAFAQTFALPVSEVITPTGQAQGTQHCFAGEGILINSGVYSGMNSATAIQAIGQTIIRQKQGQPQVKYKLRDWLISRQRYWGAPIPIIHCPECGPVAVPEEQLPVRLPDIQEFAPTGDGRSPLARIREWVEVACPVCGRAAERETDTMDGFACSSWYFLRFTNPTITDRPFDPAAVAYWMPVDTYVGGAEHAVMHLLYARFWTKVMFDAGLINFTEPFTRLLNQGVLHAADGRRMSKSKGNVVPPDAVVARYGTDATRAYTLFIGPFEGNVIWDETGIRGITRWLERFWQLAQEMATYTPTQPAEPAVERRFIQGRHRLVQRITREMELFKFNTAVAALMEYQNDLIEKKDAGIASIIWRETIATVASLMAPITPFITESVWHEVLGETSSIHQQPWPTYDAELVRRDEVEMVIQVNGRVRDRMQVTANEDEEGVHAAAIQRPIVQQFINGATIQQVIIVPGKLVNIVTR